MTQRDQGAVATIDYVRLVLLSVVVAIPISIATMLFIVCYNAVIGFVSETVPSQLGLDPVGVGALTIAVATGGAFVVGLITRTFGHGPHKPMRDELVEDGRVEPKGMPSMLTAAFITIASGASVGPEAPLAHMSGGLGTIVAERRGLDRDDSRILTTASISSVFGALFATPGGAAFATLEFTGMLSFPMYATLIAGLMAAIVGTLGAGEVLRAIGAQGVGIAGMYAFEDLPELGILDAAWAVVMGLLGLVIAVVFRVVNDVSKRVVAPLHERTVLRMTLVGLSFGIVGAILPLTLYSGEKQLETVFEDPAAIGVGILLLMALLKMANLSLALNAGFPGGFVFPVLFIGGVVGSAVSLLVPGVPAGVAIAGMMAGVGGAVARMPFAIILIVSLLTQQELLFVNSISALTGFFGAILLSAGSARQTQQDAEARAGADRGEPSPAQAEGR